MTAKKAAAPTQTTTTTINAPEQPATTPVEQPVAAEPTKEELAAKVAELSKQLATPAPAAVVSKQDLAIKQLLHGWSQAGKDLSQMSIVDVNGAKLVKWSPDAATIKVGKGGGYDIVEVKSFAKADLQTMLRADELLAKQNGRQAKTATANGTASALSVEKLKKELADAQAKLAQQATPAQRKEQEHERLEQQLQQQA